MRGVKRDADDHFKMPDIISVTTQTPTSGAVKESAELSSPSRSSTQPKTIGLEMLAEYPIMVMQYKNIEDIPSDVHALYEDLFLLSKLAIPIIPQDLMVRSISSAIPWTNIFLRASLLMNSNSCRTV